MPTAYLSPSLLQDLTNVSVSPGAGNTGYPLVWNNASGRFELAVLGVAGGGTGTSNGSITGTGALTFAATGANNNVTLTPGAGGYGNIAGVSIRALSGAHSQSIGSGSNSTGDYNIFQGLNAGLASTVGVAQLAQGVNAGLSNTTGLYWIAQGLNSGFSNNAQDGRWIAQGVASAFSNTQGAYWMAQGEQAGYTNQTGSFWMAQGPFAGYTNQTGSYWMAQGPYAGYNNPGSYWIAQGFEAGYFDNRSNYWNVATGRSKSLVVGNFDTDCLYFGHAGPITSAATCPTPTAAVHCAASTTSRASLRIDSGTAPTSPNNGDIWFDGTDLKVRVGGVTKTFSLV